LRFTVCLRPVSTSAAAPASGSQLLPTTPAWPVQPGSVSRARAGRRAGGRAARPAPPRPSPSRPELVPGSGGRPHCSRCCLGARGGARARAAALPPAPSRPPPGPPAPPWRPPSARGAPPYTAAPQTLPSSRWPGLAALAPPPAGPRPSLPVKDAGSCSRWRPLHTTRTHCTAGLTLGRWRINLCCRGQRPPPRLLHLPLTSHHPPQPLPGASSGPAWMDRQHFFVPRIVLGCFIAGAQ
jgi:hypothetical protein